MRADFGLRPNKALRPSSAHNSNDITENSNQQVKVRPPQRASHGMEYFTRRTTWMMNGQAEGEGRYCCDEARDVGRQWALLIPPTEEGAQPNCFDAAAISAMSCHGCRERCRRESHVCCFVHLSHRNEVMSTIEETTEERTKRKQRRKRYETETIVDLRRQRRQQRYDLQQSLPVFGISAQRPKF